MKDLFEADEFDETTVNSIIANKLEESITLDFKAGAALDSNDKSKGEISKDVSAFANSAGGFIIYGINEADHVATGLSPVDGNVFTKEWLEQVIQTRVQRKIDGLLIHPVRLGGEISKTIYVVRIPESTNAPHMSSDKRFYKRYNFESVRMEEYEVRALYNRKNLTVLEIGDLLITQGSSMRNAGKLAHADFHIAFQTMNIGSAIENQFKLEITIPEFVYSKYPKQSNPITQFLIRTNDKYSVFSVPNESPVFQGEITTVARALIHVDRSGFQYLSNLPLFVKLYFSNGVKQKAFEMNRLLEYDGAPLTVDIFN